MSYLVICYLHIYYTCMYISLYRVDFFQRHDLVRNRSTMEPDAEWAGLTFSLFTIGPRYSEKVYSPVSFTQTPCALLKILSFRHYLSRCFKLHRIGLHSSNSAQSLASGTTSQNIGWILQLEVRQCSWSLLESREDETGNTFSPQYFKYLS